MPMLTAASAVLDAMVACLSRTMRLPVIKVVGDAAPLEPAGSFLDGAELLEELVPADDAFFAAFKAVGAVERGSVGG